MPTHHFCDFLGVVDTCSAACPDQPWAAATSHVPTLLAELGAPAERCPNTLICLMMYIHMSDDVHCR